MTTPEEYSEFSKFEHRVPSHVDGVRLDKHLGDILKNEAVSREKIKKLIKDGFVTIDDKKCTKPNTKIFPDMSISITMPVVENSIVPEEGDIDILHRDNDLIVINKEAGLTVHPCPSCPEGTLVHRLAHSIPEITQMEGFRPGIVHRIDKDTSGLLIVALNEKTRLALSEAFASRTVSKEYLALVHGTPPKSGEIKEPIGRDPKMKIRMAVVPNTKEAHSEFRTLYSDPKGKFSLVAVKIYTGRTHQIRVHMSHIGYPLWGDTLYGGGVKANSPLAPFASRQMLHAWKLNFEHPATKEQMSFTCHPPQDFINLIERLTLSVQRVALTGMPGCGKSVVLSALAKKGIATWSADTIVHKLYEHGADGWYVLRGRFGSEVCPDEGPVNRRALFERMQESKASRNEVEQLVHPLILHDLTCFWQEHSADPFAVAEIPLLHETHWDREIDIVAGVRCEGTSRQNRLKKNRDWSDDLIATMDSWQWAEDDKMKACHIIIENNGSLEALNQSVDKFIDAIMRVRAKKLQQTIDAITALWSE
ncbi:dephospho-CoA kinase [Halodesulfovibrio marinisediminis]|uniref:Dephospho-CoA kinase n=1 Tax=Halodesulfovibrio marinisediminis DSM 17456 TaxID=1121457 RepID=A0A1N6IDE5_9BACT|nr:dephospho-CoA kinase [Halodesulfovibrio marinisediminis]SIO30037.1 dephospho-CoA kinase [Halodesulfovibrio marinisediminis DSM 17456]